MYSMIIEVKLLIKKKYYKADFLTSALKHVKINSHESVEAFISLQVQF